MRIALLCLATLTACNRTPNLPTAQGGYTGALQGAMQQLRQSFNSGGCGAIYQEASEEFRELASEVEWRQTCENLRTRLGPWTGFTLGSVDLKQSLQARVEGTGEFQTGSYELRVAWRLGDSKPRLFSFQLQGAGQKVAVPEPRRREPAPRLDRERPPTMERSVLRAATRGPAAERNRASRSRRSLTVAAWLASVLHPAARAPQG